jgi:hypothetical protein
MNVALEFGAGTITAHANAIPAIVSDLGQA